MAGDHLVHHRSWLLSRAVHAMKYSAMRIAVGEAAVESVRILDTRY